MAVLTGTTARRSLAAFAVNRALTTAVVTPGGIGIAETGTLALLLGLGAPAPQATAGVLLFAAFTYALEIPLGGLAWAIVLTRRRHRPPHPLSQLTRPGSAHR